jgi:hypothetical protein
MALKPTSFPELFARAEEHADYWVAGLPCAFHEAPIGFTSPG